MWGKGFFYLRMYLHFDLLIMNYKKAIYIADLPLKMWKSDLSDYQALHMDLPLKASSVSSVLVDISLIPNSSWRNQQSTRENSDSKHFNIVSGFKAPYQAMLI